MIRASSHIIQERVERSLQSIHIDASWRSSCCSSYHWRIPTSAPARRPMRCRQCLPLRSNPSNNSCTKIALQSNADHPRMCVSSYARTNVFPVTLTWSDDLDIRTWSRYSEDVSKMKFPGQSFQKLEHDQDKHRQTDATECITMPHSWVVKISGDISARVIPFVFRRQFCSSRSRVHTAPRSYHYYCTCCPLSSGTRNLEQFSKTFHWQSSNLGLKTFELS